MVMRDMDNFYDWKRKNIKRYEINLNKETDKEVIEHLDKIPNKKQYLIELIKKDMKKKEKK